MVRNFKNYLVIHVNISGKISVLVSQILMSQTAVSKATNKDQPIGTWAGCEGRKISYKAIFIKSFLFVH